MSQTGGQDDDIDDNPYSHTLTHMKTTIELPDLLFQTAKETAARRRITLKELFTHALTREVAASTETETDADFEIDDLGLPVLRHQTGEVTGELIRQLQEDE